MRKQIFSAILCAIPFLGIAQGAIDLYQISQQNMRGTARFMSMAGAFGALGGDISTLNQNPAGIGVYRSSDLAATIDFDIQSTSTSSQGSNYGSINKFVVSCNNAGYVGAYNVNGETLKNLNWGVTYNRSASFNRRYAGGFNNLNSSLSNVIAGISNSMGLTTKDLTTTDAFDPYIDSSSPWMSILAYDSYLINPQRDGKNFKGIFGDGTTGLGEYETVEEGGINEFNLNLGGNFSNVIYWGIGVGITDINYRATTYYGESLRDAYISTSTKTQGRGTADWGIYNSLRTVGSGYNFKLGVIVKPINELRFGFAFHTPTYYSLYDQVYTNTSFAYNNNQFSGDAMTNNGYPGEMNYTARTPWKFIASAATVVGGKAILSFDYEFVGYNTMAVAFNGNTDKAVSNHVNNYYKPSNIFRVGGEFRVTSQLSVRAGYSHQSSPMNNNLQNENIFTAGTMSVYMFDNSIQHITAGLGYKINNVYLDLAYVHKNRTSEYHAYSPLVESGVVLIDSPTATIKDKNNQIVMTLGLRF